MLFLRLGLIAAALACVFVCVASWRAGYPPEVAIVRGVVAWVAVAVVAYGAELVVATTRVRTVPVARAQYAPPPAPAPAASAPRPPQGSATAAAPDGRADAA